MAPDSGLGINLAPDGGDRPYVGRFAPSPSGPLHAGSLVAAMASYLDARAHHGRWLVRIEDVDEARTVPGAADSILHTLAACGMVSDGPVLWQSRRSTLYAAAFAQLSGHTYPCACSRREIADSLVAPAPGVGVTLLYPGTCRHGMAPGKSARAWRVRVPDIGSPGELIGFTDRACGLQTQHLATEAGDFVLKRADGFWAYQLAVVVDDAAQGVTDVVRGRDLLESTPRQMYLQRLLGMAVPRTLHTPLVCNDEGEKLSKQTGAAALDLRHPEAALTEAATVLALDIPGAKSVADFWHRAVPLWAAKHGL